MDKEIWKYLWIRELVNRLIDRDPVNSSPTRTASTGIGIPRLNTNGNHGKDRKEQYQKFVEVHFWWIR